MKQAKTSVKVKVNPEKLVTIFQSKLESQVYYVKKQYDNKTKKQKCNYLTAKKYKCVKKSPESDQLWQQL